MGRILVKCAMCGMQAGCVRCGDGSGQIWLKDPYIDKLLVKDPYIGQILVTDLYIGQILVEDLYIGQILG